jgi:hypothetical protein
MHYYQDNRALAGAASCGGGGCTEGQACGCSGGQACEPDPIQTGVCAPPADPTVSISLRGDTAPAALVPVPPDLLNLASPCFAWHALDVSWSADGGVAIQAAGDGGLIQYWGDHTDATRQCAEPAGGWAPRSPPTFQ